jgi:hypothetical protein
VLLPSVSIAITTGSNPSCAGASVTFTATPTNGGTTPSYQWKINGGDVGTDSPTFTTSSITNGQIVTCVMTTNATCPTSATATSSGINMTINALVTPSVSIAITTGANPLCTGDATIFTATPTNGGGSPAYQWKLNGGDVGSNIATYSNSGLANGDVVTCQMTSNATCPSTNPVASTGITITNNTPAQPTFSVSSTNVALGQNGVAYTVTNVSGVSYAWSYSGTGATISGAPSNSVTIDFATNATSGNLTVTPSYAGCTGIPRVLAITAAPSNESNVTDNTNYATGSPEFNSNIGYISFINASASTTGKMIPMKIRIQDGGNDFTDADRLNTILSAISFTVRDHLAVNQLAQIKTAILTTTTGTVVGTATKVGSELVFTGMSGANVTATDVDNGGTGDRILHLRVSFDETLVVDNTKLIFQVSSVTAGSSSSTFAAANGGAAQSDNSNGNDRNRIEVVADRLAFVQQPSTVSISTNMSPAPTVAAQDLYGRRDLDFTTSISMTSDGTPSSQPSATPTAGLATFGSVNHTVAATGRTLTATTTGLAFSNTVNSNTFDITTYVNGDWHSITGTGLLWNNTANWMQVISGSLSAPGGGGGSGYPNAGNPNVHLYATMSTNGSRSVSDLTIYNGAQLTTTSGPCTVQNMLWVKTGGTMNMSNLLNINGTLQVDSAGTFIYAYTNSSSRSTSVWNGTENFHPYSIFRLTQLQNTAGFLFIEDKDDLTENTYNGFAACFGIMQFERASGSGAMGLFPSGFVKNLSHGDVIFRTSTSDVRMADAGSGFTTTIGGNFIIESTFGSNINFSNSAVTGTLTVKKNLIHDGTAALRLCSSTTTTNMTLNIDSNMTISNTGSFVFNATNDPDFTGIVNLKGDLTVGASAFITNAATTKQGSFNFRGIGNGSTPELTQMIRVTSTNATRNRYIDFSICNGAYAKLGAIFDLGINAKVIDSVGATLDFGFDADSITSLYITTYSTGAQFEARQGCILKITSPDGLYDEWDRAAYTAAGVTVNTGNVRAIAKTNRSISPIATFHYIGRANQKTGDAPNVSLSGTADAKIVICELDSNIYTLTPTVSFGVTSTTTLSPTGGKLDIRKGQFIETETEFIFGAGGTLYMAPGTLYRIVKGYNVLTDETGFGGGTFIPRMLGSTYPYVLTGGTIELAGNANTGNGFQTLRGTFGGRPDYNSVKFSSNNDYDAVTKTATNYKNLSSTTTVDTAVIITNNAIVDCIGMAGTAQSFDGNGALVMDGNSRIRLKNVSTTQPELAGNNRDYSLTGGTVEFYGTSATQQQQLRGNYRTAPSSPVKINYYNIDVNAAAANLQTFATLPNSTQLGSVGNVDVNSSFLLTGTLNVNAPAVLRMDQNDFIDNGTGTSQVININSGAGLLYANEYGIKTSGTGVNDGNIRTSGTRNFSTSANYGFVSSGNMVSGNGLPANVAGLYIYKTFGFNGVTLNNGGTTVNGILGLQRGKILSSDTHKLTLATVSTSDIKSPANVGGVQDMGTDSSYVVGIMGHISNSTSQMIFPIGSYPVYGPIALTPQGTTAQTYNCDYVSESFGNQLLDPANSPQLDHVSYVEYWNVNSTVSGTSDDARVKLFWRDHSIVGPPANWSELRVVHFDGTDWNTEGNSPTTSGLSTSWGSVETNIYVPNFSPITLSTTTSANPLPVELLSFTASAKCPDIVLNWSTATELNNDYFEVQHSFDGINFETIEVVDGNGTTNQLQNYQFTHMDVVPTINFYRLKQVDYDGTEDYSATINAACGLENNTVGLMNTLSGNELILQFQNSKNQDGQLIIYGANGQVVNRKMLALPEGYSQVRIDISNLPNAMYIVQWFNGNEIVEEKFIKNY